MKIEAAAEKLLSTNDGSWAKGYAACKEAMRGELEWQRAEVDRLRTALADAGLYVAVCPVPDALTDLMRADRLERRDRIARAAYIAKIARGGL